MLWFLQDWGRLDQERAAIEEMQANGPWLKGVSWGIDTEGSGGLRLDADIEAHGTLYPVRMVYPATFPANPPTVKPRGTEKRWSTHQYGAGGELCLEWGPDTWLPEVTGAQVLESAFRLLNTENPKGSGPGQSVPSRHQLTAGQRLRRSFYRFPATHGLRCQLAAVPESTSGTFTAIVLLQGESFMAVIRELRLPGGKIWSDPTVPHLEGDGLRWDGTFLPTKIPKRILEAIDSIEDLKTALIEHGSRDCGSELDVALGEPRTHRLLLVGDVTRELHLFQLNSDGPDLTRFDTIALDDDRSHKRLGPETESLDGKRVGIVGLGSLGSKIALSLARSGATHFLLIDDDIFLPENVCRHTLDWRNIGEHKVVGVRAQLMTVSPTITVDVCRLRVTGQESTASVAGVLRELLACDLIVDATGDPATFNQLAMVSRQYRCPLVWAEVYGGGVGGMVARHRPGKDADPFAMRAQYHRFTAEAHAAPPARALAPYTTVADTGEPLIATDADVGVIAKHAVRMILDALIEREPSLFPYSLYLVGLVRGWVFEQPFQVIPIDTGTSATITAFEIPPEPIVRGVQFISDILKQSRNGSSSAD